MLVQFKKYIKKHLSNYEQLRKWKANGKKGNAPHIIKQKHILTYCKKRTIKTLVETGTFVGDMIFAMRNHFDTIYSIELSSELYNQAKIRFQSYTHIHLLEGDSGVVLKTLIQEIKEPTLFWLDGHYSGGTTAKGFLECPIFEELNAIFSSPIHSSFVILIDDARLFKGTNDYPTIEELQQFIRSKTSESTLKVEDDIIHIRFIANDSVA